MLDNNSYEIEPPNSANVLAGLFLLKITTSSPSEQFILVMSTMNMSIHILPIISALLFLIQTGTLLFPKYLPTPSACPIGMVATVVFCLAIHPLLYPTT